MRLVAFDDQRLGVVRDDQVVEITDVLGDPGPSWPPVHMVRLINDFDSLREAIEDRAARGVGRPLADVALTAPVVWPNKLLAYPANYQAHIDEMRSRNRADFNGFFLKANSSISGPRDPIVLPDIDGVEVHHECELALVIGRRGRHIPPERARDYIFGYMCLIDVTLRGPQERVARKSFDTFAPTGPWIVTSDEVEDPGALQMELRVNGEVRQRANTRDLIVDVPHMIAMASAVATLLPGDVIATGTPQGVGPLRPGDQVRIDIEAVGSMTVPVVRGTHLGGDHLAWLRPRVSA